MPLDWGNIIQVIITAGIALIWIVKLQGRIDVLQTEIRATDTRVSTVELRIERSLEEIKQSILRLSEKMDK